MYKLKHLSRDGLYTYFCEDFRRWRDSIGLKRVSLHATQCYLETLDDDELEFFITGFEHYDAFNLALDERMRRIEETLLGEQGDGKTAL